MGGESGPQLVPWKKFGRSKSGINADPTRWRFFSNSGAVFDRNLADVFSKAGNGINTRESHGIVQLVGR